MRMIKSIKGYEDINRGYFVTRNGDVLSKCNNAKGLRGEFKKLKQYTKTGGYKYCALVKDNGKTKYIRVHRLVCSAFKDNPLNKEYVNHIDGNRQNNNINNLEWVTPKENNDHSLSKTVYCYNDNLELVRIFKSIGDCKNLGFNRGHVGACCRNEENHHKKHVFSFTELNKEEIVQRLSKPSSVRRKRE